MPVAGARVEVKDKKGFSPLDFGMHSGQEMEVAPPNTAASLQNDINSASSAIAKTNGTSVGHMDGEEDEPAIRKLKSGVERDRNYGVEFATAGAVIEGTANTDH